MRVVLDTNIFVSALVFPGGTAEKALMRMIEGRDQLIISRPIIHELLDVLSTKFARDPEELAHVAVFLSKLGEVVRPRHKRSVLKDEADNRILECAETGSADVIVTGDRRMLALGEYKQINIVTLRKFLDG